MTEFLPEPGFFYTGGELREGAPSYIERDADRSLLAAALRGELCYVLGPSQMGKSSLINHARGRLRALGVASALVDLQQFGAGSSADQWLVSFLAVVRAQLALPAAPDAWWDERPDEEPLARFARYLTEQASDRRAVIFVDEIGGLRRFPFGDGVLAAIASLHRPAATGVTGVSFALFGAVPPETAGNPAAMARRIYLGDLRLEDVLAWSQVLAGARPESLARVYHWTSGHPYLTQKMAQAVEARGQASATEVDALVDELFFQQRWEDGNLASLKARIDRSDNARALVGLYRAVRAGEPVSIAGHSLLHEELRLSGLVAPGPDGRLHVHNRIYHAVFDERWMGRVLGA